MGNNASAKITEDNDMLYCFLNNFPIQTHYFDSIDGRRGPKEGRRGIFT